MNTMQGACSLAAAKTKQTNIKCLHLNKITVNMTFIEINGVYLEPGMSHITSIAINILVIYM